MRARAVRAAVVGLVTIALVPACLAQETDPKEEVQAHYNVKGMIDQAVRNIAARYNLNQEQYERTQQMMEEGVNRFLEEHADQVYPLIRDLTRAEMDTANLSVSQRRRIGKGAQPLVAEAYRVILEYNQEWGKILSDEQKQLHKWDLDEMEGQIELIRDRMDKMAAGRAVEGNPIFPEPQPVTKEPPRPKKPGPGIPTAGPKQDTTATRDNREEDLFDNYVQKFIKEYNLDAGQREAALSIMREYKGSAEVYRKAKKADYDNANQKAEQARKRGDFEKAKEAEKEIDQLNERILQLLADMKERLMTIPRESQKQAREQAAAGKKPDEKPAATEKPPAEEKAPASEKAPVAKPEEKTKEKPKAETTPKDKGDKSSSDKPEPSSENKR